MTKKLFSLCVAIAWTVALMAQQISVVSGSTTTIYRTLQAAIEAAPAGSVIYLPGGGFSIADSVKITKKLTIIGIGHKSNNDNVDGVTTISGNLFFNEGSSGSAIMACYITGNVNIGEENAAVNNMLIRYCNLNSIQVSNSGCTGTFVNQNYIRGDSNFGNSEVTICNNVLRKIINVATGVISYNICCHYCSGAARYNQYHPALENVNNSTIVHNIFRGEGVMYSYFHSGESCIVSNNLYVGWSVGEEPIIIDAAENDLFQNVNGWAVTPTSNFHFKETYEQYKSLCGIYAGDGFDDSQMPPIPYISSKSIPGETDASGKLHIKITVNAN